MKDRMNLVWTKYREAEKAKKNAEYEYRQAQIEKQSKEALGFFRAKRTAASKLANKLRHEYNRAYNAWIQTPAFLMRKQQPTPVDTGTQSTEADAVQAVGKGKRGSDTTFKVGSKLTTQIITLGHLAYLALEKPGHEIDLALTKRLWIRNVRELLDIRLKAGATLPRIAGIDVAAYYGLQQRIKVSRTDAKIKRLEAELAKLKAKQAKK